MADPTSRAGREPLGGHGVSSDSRPPVLVAVLGPTATGKSALALSLAEQLGGEIISCDSTAVYRGFDIGTDKVPAAQQRGVPHHLVDVVDPSQPYSAALFVGDAMAAIQLARSGDHLPILVGGTGLYYRALTRGLFPGPGRDDRVRERLTTIAQRRGPERLHRWLARVDPESAQRIASRDEKRLVRALEVFMLTRRPLTAHFADTVSPLAGYRVIPFGLRLGAEELARRIAQRVDRQFEEGLLGEIRDLLASGVPVDARPFSGLVYRQALEHLNGVRDETATRELIVRENRRYARRQLTWFRKEPNLQWIDLPGEHPDTASLVFRSLVGCL